MLKPLYDKVLVSMQKSPESSDGGLYIPDNIRERSMTATVIAVGDGYRSTKGVTPLKVGVGMKVLVPRGAGYEIKLNGEDFLVVREDELLGIFSASA